MQRTRTPIRSQPERRPISLIWVIGALLSWLLLPACTGTGNLVKIGDGPLGAVSLERLATRGTTALYSGPPASFQASHPVEIQSAQVTRLLSGLHISGIERATPTDDAAGYPLFSHDEVEFLVPFISKALAEAEQNQRVKFSVKDDGVITDGTLYVYRDLFRVSLSHYRAKPGQTDGRLASYTLAFRPGEAVVHTDTPQSWMIIEPEQPRIAVSLNTLNQLPPPTVAQPTKPIAAGAAPGTVSPPIPDQNRLQQELQATKDLVVKQAEELQRVKAELESMRQQQLADKELAAPKAKQKVMPRKPAPSP